MEQTVDPISADIQKSKRSSKDAIENMVWIAGGTFLMGSDRHYPEEAPAHQVTVEGFWSDDHTVTNEEFRRSLSVGSSKSGNQLLHVS